VARDIQQLTFGEIRDRPPGYPLVLLCTGSCAEPTRLLFGVSLALHFASAGMLFNLLTRTGLSLWLSGAFLVLSITPFYVEPAAIALTEVFTRFFVTFGLFQTLEGVMRRSMWRFTAAGVSFGYAGWTHPLFLTAFLPVLAGLCLLRCILHWSPLNLRQFLCGSGCVAGAGLAALGGLYVFNSCAYGFKGISPFGGTALSTRTARFVERMPQRHGEIRRILVETRDRELVQGATHAAGSYIWKARPLLKKATGLGAQELDGLLRQVNLELIKGSPLLYLNEVGCSWVGFWSPSAGDLASFKSRALGFLWVLVDFLVVAGWACSSVTLGSVGLLMRFRRFRASVSRGGGLAGASKFGLGVHFQAVGASMICWTALVACAFGVGNPRYRQPVDLLVLACAVQGVGMLAKLLRRPSISRTPTARSLSPEAWS